ncbi:MAG: hypothetical protein DRJ38_07340 [Thermoprotei archaeon]|nr:MAG: hypothetical protein DRJ38_07340 [Thermoprotei archaeon]
MNRKEYHIVTSGISLFTNFLRKGRSEDLIKKYNLEKWLEKGYEEEIEEITAHLESKSEIYEAFLEFIKRNPYQASAETNSLLKYCEYTKVSPWNITVKLFTTDTALGKFVAFIVKDYLASQGFTIDGKPTTIKYFGWGVDFFEKALVEVLDNISQTILKAKEKNYLTALNATGGFKPETTFAVIAALMSEVDRIYYIHETFKEIVILPGIPLAIKKEYAELLAKFAEPVEKWFAKEHMHITEYTILELKEKGLIEETPEGLKIKKWIKSMLI